MLASLPAHTRTCTNACRILIVQLAAGSCPDYAVRLTEYPEGRVELFLKKKLAYGWYPLSGQGFAENDHGANTVCSQLGYNSGVVSRTWVKKLPRKPKLPREQKAFWMGRCGPQQWGLKKRCNRGCGVVEKKVRLRVCGLVCLLACLLACVLACLLA